MVAICLVRHRVTMLGAVTALAVLAAGCGSDDEPSASSEPTEEATSVEVWVDDVCTAVSAWRDDVTTAVAPLEDPKNVSANIFNDAVTAVGDATETMADEVGSLSPPDLEGGEEAQAELSSLSDSLASEVDVIKGAVPDDTATADDLVAAAATISGSVTTIGTDIEAALASIAALDGMSELKDAIASTESCQSAASAG